MDLLKPEYNILKIAGTTLGRKHSVETIAKLKNYKHSLEALTKLRLAKELSGNRIIIINKENNNINTFKSVRAAARYLNVSHPGLEYCMDKNILLKNKYLIIKLIRIKY
jgi:hypothetical protein